MKIILSFICLVFGGIVVETIGARLKRAKGGTEIPIHLAPYYVTLRVNRIHFCGGAFTSRRHVLTAARCVVDKLSKSHSIINVVSGTDGRIQPGIRHSVMKMSPHPRFLAGNLWCDVAVITLSAPVEWNINQHYIALPVAEPPYSEYATLTSLKVRDSEIGRIGLQNLEVCMWPIISKFSHAYSYDHSFKGIMDIYNTTGKRDAGAPLVYKRRIVGIASEMIPGNQYTRYYVNVFKFKTFIENTMADEISSSSNL